LISQSFVPFTAIMQWTDDGKGTKPVKMCHLCQKALFQNGWRKEPNGNRPTQIHLAIELMWVCWFVCDKQHSRYT